MGKKVLIISTSHAQLGDTAQTTGLWAEELVVPYDEFVSHGLDVTVASTKGGKIPLDDSSLNPPYLSKEVESFISDDTKMKLVLDSKAFTSFKPDDFDAVFLPGGHGCCYDFPDNPDLSAFLSKAYTSKKIVASVCHGPMCLAKVVDEAGVPIVKGKKVTGFSNTEEDAVGKSDVVPFLLEDKLKELGGEYQKASDWSAFAVQDGNLITGQNPGSSKKVAELVVQALS